jgi:serine/threonine protein kinase
MAKGIDMEDLTGKQFGQYQIVAPLGEGGMAAVYKAYQPAMERFVAIKVLPRQMAVSDEFLSRFRREAKLLAQLQHPHILPVFDYGEVDGYPYIVMPFVRSGTLTEVLKRGRLPFSEVRRITIQLGDALGYAHGRGMIHRDIKPSNVLIDERGNCLLTDFGLARMVEASAKLTTSGTIMGTPAYMSPEQGAGSFVDRRSDIYSLGIVLYEMVTSRVPYVAETPIAVVFKHIQDPLPSARNFNPALPESIELVLLKALAKSPEDRFQTAEDFVRAIQLAIPERESDQKAAVSSNEATLPILLEEESIATPQSVPALPTSLAQAGAANRGPAGRTVEDSKARGFPIWAGAGIGGIVLLALLVFFVINRPDANNEIPPMVTSIPTLTSTPINSPVPSPLPASTSTLEIASGVGFRDDFIGQLAEGWTWLYEDPKKWSLSAVEGSLQILASDASFDGPYTPLNILLRDVPTGDFEVTTSVQFTPTSDFQFAGLVVYQDSKNVLQFGHAFCDVVNACVGNGVYFDNFENGSVTGTNNAAPFHRELIYLRLQRQGNTYTGYYSEDGKNWIKLGEHSRDLSPVRVGLMAAQAPEEIPALFDYFTMNAPSP